MTESQRKAMTVALDAIVDAQFELGQEQIAELVTMALDRKLEKAAALLREALHGA